MDKAQQKRLEFVASDAVDCLRKFLDLTKYEYASPTILATQRQAQAIIEYVDTGVSRKVV